MQWSKNVLEEHKRPDQIINGHMNPNYCVLLGLALHLEYAEMFRIENNSPLLFRITKLKIRMLFEEITSKFLVDKSKSHRSNRHPFHQ